MPDGSMQRKLHFANTMLTMINLDKFDVGFIWFTDEALFRHNGFVKNKTSSFGEQKSLSLVS